MATLTGNKDTDFLILMQLNDYELGKVCQANKYVKSLCDDNDFWRNRFMKKYDKNLSIDEAIRFKTFLGFFSWRELNIYFSQFKNKRIPILVKLLKDEKYIDEAINLIIKDELPVWVDRNLLIKETRKNIVSLLFKKYDIGLFEIRPILSKISILKSDIDILNSLQNIHDKKRKTLWKDY